MVSNIKVKDRLDGADNFRSWKHRILLILKDNELLDYVKKGLPQQKEEKAKEKHKKNVINAKRILLDSIKDQLIHHVSELKTPKEIFLCLIKII